ncbi:hypothetical protein [Vibrio parahaemolyticus]|uniref:hypothetical protein n=1 Tax=Vibrio parahaemolyticus TaxID=670 RepID=UPI00301D6B95|nr:hypothetical protein [Vibrio parahaemolyticus]MDG2804758.1 hypothetical protein [Vibrio parahaemolyticus]MDG3027293.1 hypothetical protein [Vibrio parahaemolyticus]HCG7776249.1 hypothetical protein [Vibrio parahaemolyticus]
MSQRVDGILRMVAQLSAEEKAELMYKVSGRGSGFGNDFEFRQKGGAPDAINFAPRSGAKCPVCGK